MSVKMPELIVEFPWMPVKRPELIVEFPWISKILTGFWKQFPKDYENTRALELLQKNIEEEILKVKNKNDFEKGKLVFECIQYFYNHFVRKWFQCKKPAPQMEIAWVHILSSLVKVSLILSQGDKNSEWIKKVLTRMMRFPGGNNLMYDTLLNVHILNKKYQPVYASILMRALIQSRLFVPMIISDPAEYLKVGLLFRRLKFLIKDPADKALLRIKASKILAPSSLSSWLLAHDFRGTWIQNTFKINLGTNIFQKLAGEESENEVVEILRKILLPRICTEQTIDQVTIKRKNVSNSLENEQLNVTDSFKKRKSSSVKNCENVPFPSDDSKDIALNKMKRKKKYVIADERKEKEVGKAKKNQHNFMGSNDSEGASNNKKRKISINAQKNPEIVHGKIHEDSLLKDISQTSENTKRRKRKRKRRKTKESGSNSKESEFVAMDHVSDSEDLSFIVNEINKSETVPNESKCPSKVGTMSSASSCSDEDDEPVIVTEIIHYSKFGRSSSCRKKGKYIKTELNSNTETKSEPKNIFVIDSEPNPCITDSGAVQRTYNTIYDSEQKHVSAREKPETIVDEKSLNTSVVLSKNEKLLSETCSNLKTSIKSHTSEETEDSYIGSKIFPAESVPNFDGKGLKFVIEASLTSDNQININENAQDFNQDADNVISPNIEEPSVHINQTDKESSRDSAVQTENLDHFTNQASDILETCINCRNTESGLNSEKLVSKTEDIPTRISFQKETTRETVIFQRRMSVLVFHKSCMPDHSSTSDTLPQANEMQEDDHASIETDVLNSDTDKVDLASTNLISTEMIESNSEVLFRKSSFLDKKENIMQSQGPPKSTIDPPLSNIPCLKNDGILSQNVVESESIINSEWNNRESVQDDFSIESKSVISLVPPFPDPLDNKSLVQSIDNPLNTHILSEEIEKRPLSDSLENKSFIQWMDNPLNTNTSFQKIEINEELIVLDSDDHIYIDFSLPNKVDPDIVNSDDNACLEIDNPKVLEDSTSPDIHGPSPNDSTQGIPKYHMKGLFFDVKSPILKIEADLPEDSQRSASHQIFDKKQHRNIEVRSGEVKTPNSSAVNGLKERMLKFVENVSCAPNESVGQNIFKGDLTSILNSPSLGFLPCVNTPENENSTKCLSFCHPSKTSEFLQYRDISIDRDNRSEDTLSENKSTLKTVASEYPSDASISTENEESNSSSDNNSHELSSDDSKYATYVVKTEFSYENTIERHRFDGVYDDDEEEDEIETNKSQDFEIDISPKNETPKKLLNPVVNLGERCDSKTYVRSIVADECSQLPNIKVENETKPLESNEVPSTKSLSLINEITLKREVSEDLPSDDMKHVSIIKKCDEIGNTNNEAKIEFHPEQKDVKELHLTADQEITILHQKQESVELKCKKELPQDQEVTAYDIDQELTVCNENQDSMELSEDRELQELSRNNKGNKSQEVIETKKESKLLVNTKLGKKPVPTVATKKLAHVDENSCVLDQNSSATSGRSLRSRIPFAKSNQEVGNSKPAGVAKRSSKRLKKEANLNLGTHFNELSLNSPKTIRSKPNDSSNKSSSEIVDDVKPSTSNQRAPCRRLTPASFISSNGDSKAKGQDPGSEEILDHVEPPASNNENVFRRLTRGSAISSIVAPKIKDQDTDRKGYNLRSRKSAIMPGKLRL